MSSTARNALVVIAAVLGAAALYWLKDILGPPVLAAFLLIMVDGMARSIRRRAPKLPAQASLITALVLVMLAFAGSVWIMIHGFVSIAGELPSLGARVDAIMAETAGLLHLKVAPSLSQLLARLNVSQYAGSFALDIGGVAWDALFVLIYLGFLLAARRSFGRKLGELFATRERREEAKRVFEHIRDGVESYVWVQTVVNAIVAVLAFAVMFAVGLENPLFWAFVVFVTGYIPIVGGVIALAGPGIFALIQFETPWPAVLIMAGIQVILFGMGNVVMPRMQARSMNIDPVVVLLSLAFWGALWGPTGAFLSTPLTVVVMAIVAEFRGSRWIAVLISEDGAPYPVEPPPDEVRPTTPRRRRSSAAAE
jgi:predicted PurR-regulated permease PerM